MLWLYSVATCLGLPHRTIAVVEAEGPSTIGLGAPSLTQPVDRSKHDGASGNDSGYEWDAGIKRRL